MLSLLNRHPIQILQQELQAQQRGVPVSQGASWSPHVDIQETDAHFLLFADIPGVGPEDLKIEVEDDVLVLSGKRESGVDDSVSELRRERFQGEFSRSFRLSERISREGIGAEVKNGVLRLILPKVKPSSPKPIAIDFH